MRSLDEQVTVLFAIDDGKARQRIKDTFADPGMVIIYRGVQRGLTQKQTAAALKVRGLPKAHQSEVSVALAQLEDKKFVRKVGTGGYAIREGWADFGLEKAIKKTLKSHEIDDLL